MLYIKIFINDSPNEYNRIANLFHLRQFYIMYIMKCINIALNEYLYYYPLTYLNEYIIIFVIEKKKYFTLTFFAEFLEITGLRLNYG